LRPWVIRDARRRVLPRGRTQRMLVLGGGVLLAGHFLLWTASLRYTSIAASILLVSLHPVMVAPIGMRLYAERATRRTAVGMVMALVGTCVTCAGDLHLSASALFGDTLALGGAAC